VRTWSVQPRTMMTLGWTSGDRPLGANVPWVLVVTDRL